VEEKRVIFSFWSFVAIGVTIGVASGIPIGVFGALGALWEADVVGAILTIPTVIFFNALGFGVSAVIGFIPYKWLAKKFYKLGVMSGEFSEPAEPGDVSFADSPNK
jgi:hypothetical protein